MNEASKSMLMNAVKEWTKFTNERERLRAMATEIATYAQKVVFESVTFMKTQNVDVECADVKSMKIMGFPVIVEPVVDAQFPNVKAKVNMTCSGATRAIVINPNSSISAGGQPITFDQLKKSMPDSFVANAAEFVSDAFLFIARSLPSADQPPPPAPTAAEPAAAPAPQPAAVPQAPKPPQPAAQPARSPQQAPQPPRPPQAVPPPPRPPQAVPPQPRPAQPPPRPGQPMPPKPPGSKP